MERVNGLTGFKTYKDGGKDVRMFYYRKNLQGDITHIYDADGNLKAKYLYDAWGNCKITKNEDGIGMLNPFRYRGYYFDQETSLYYVSSRYYDPETGRFINADDISILSESQNLINGLNLYSYCGNNPVMRIDPSGRAWWKTLIGILVPVVGISMLIGGAVSAINGGSFADGAYGAGFTVGASIAIIGALVATTILTGGATAGLTAALGGGFWAAVGAGAIVGGISGAIIGSGMTLLTQGISNGYDNINWGAVGKAALVGGISGFIMGGAFAAIGRGVGALGNMKYFQNRPNTFMFGGQSGNNMTIFKVGKGFRFEADIIRGFHAHFKTIAHGLSFHRTIGIISGWNAVVGFGTWGISR